MYKLMDILSSMINVTVILSPNCLCCMPVGICKIVEMKMAKIDSLIYRTQVLALCSGNNHVDFFEGFTTCTLVIDDRVGTFFGTQEYKSFIKVLETFPINGAVQECTSHISTKMIVLNNVWYYVY